MGPAALADAADCDVIVMDELGPSEAAALEFQKAVLAALDGDKPVYGVLQQADSEFLGRVAAHPRVRVVTVTEENRGQGRAFFSKHRGMSFSLDSGYGIISV